MESITIPEPLQKLNPLADYEPTGTYEQVAIALLIIASLICSFGWLYILTGKETK